MKKWRKLEEVGKEILMSMNEVSSEGNNGEPDFDNDWTLDHGYIYDITKMLSGIIRNKVIRDEVNICEECENYGGECTKYGRDFGTLGEYCAATNIIEKEMNNILGPKNVNKEPISEHWSKKDYWKACRYGLFSIKRKYIGWLYKKRWNLDWHLRLKVYENSEHIESWEIKFCFPFLKKPPFFETTENDLIVVEKFRDHLFKERIILLDNDWTDPHESWAIFKNISKLFFIPKVKGFILIDCFPDTYFMDPSFGDGKKIPPPMWPKPGFSITGEDGNRIREHLRKNCTLKADIRSKWENKDVESYNVIGQIKGKDENIISIICAHYDCWWNQGTIDEAAETALVLGIAKHMKDLEKNEDRKPKHTVKFIAFAGEEWGMRGSKDYVKKHLINGDEEVKYVINPGNFGHVDRYKDGKFILFTVHSNNDQLGKKVINIIKGVADKLKYADELKYDSPINDELEDVSGEDSEMFKKMADVLQFSRCPFKGYHRDGNNHIKGDTIDKLDRDIFKKECEMVWAVIEDLLYKHK